MPARKLSSAASAPVGNDAGYAINLAASRCRIEAHPRSGAKPDPAIVARRYRDDRAARSAIMLPEQRERRQGGDFFQATEQRSRISPLIDLRVQRDVSRCSDSASREPQVKLRSRRRIATDCGAAVTSALSECSRRLGSAQAEAPATSGARPQRHLDDLAVLQRDAAVHARRELHVVGGDQRREAGGAHQLRQRVEHMVGGARVEIAGRLVGQQDARRIGDRARDRDALLLAAGELAPAGASSRSLEAEIAEQLGRARRAPRFATGRGSSAAA